MRLRVIGGLFVAVVLVLAGMIAWALWPVTKDLPDKLAYPAAPSGSNGLTAEERQQYYHLTEGGELYPMAWLLALETEVRGKDGSVTLRPFLETIERFGMIPDPPSAYNPYGLPVGVTIGHSAVSGLQMMGLNCTACHVGELHYQGRAFRVDGGPNLSAINDFILALLIGIISGTYSSIFVAAPLLVDWHLWDDRRHGRLTTTRTTRVRRTAS